MIPPYDVNPIPYGDNLFLNVSMDGNSISIELAMSVAKYFGINKFEAGEVSGEIIKIVHGNWKLIAEKYGLARNACEYMKPAFDMDFK